ncbi:hypothetical protein [Rhizobium sp. Root482]|uniref:hypothetical protein n=1 Tax=Rhizobium sp. Root482 TaxID=1736543 RepID=UPI0006FD818E|nr:hypothetical protein [Rhizobium sp. Root482]KQY14420.1 hypothetical protein ASD31_09125 [Rhizobium sp. Root482]
MGNATVRTPDEKERLKKVGFQKGRKKTGGTVAIPPDVKEALKARTIDAVETLYDVMLNSSNDNARVKAAAYFLDPFVSKAPTTVDVNHKHSIADMLAEINQMRLKDDSRKTIDITPIASHEEADALPQLRVVSQKAAKNV